MLTERRDGLDARGRSSVILVFGRGAATRLSLALLCAMAALALAPATAFAQSDQDDPQAGPTDRAAIVDDGQSEAKLLDCSDVATRRGAQALFELYPADRFNLDADSDGQACETPQGAATAEDGTALGAATNGDRDCMDFPSQAAAQDHLRAHPSDPEDLDVANTGIACQIRPADYTDPAEDLTPVAGAISNADLDCVDFEYQQEAEMVYLMDERDPNNLDTSANADGSQVCQDLPVLQSNVYAVSGVPAGDAGGAQEGSEAPRLLAQVLPTESVDRLVLLLDLVAAVLIASGVAALLLAWRRGYSEPE